MLTEVRKEDHSPLLTLNVNQWFETSVDSHVRHETHLPAHMTTEMLTEVRIEYRTNETCPPGKATSVALNQL